MRSAFLILAAAILTAAFTPPESPPVKRVTAVEQSEDVWLTTWPDGRQETGPLTVHGRLPGGLVQVEQVALNRSTWRGRYRDGRKVGQWITDLRSQDGSRYYYSVSEHEEGVEVRRLVFPKAGLIRVTWYEDGEQVRREYVSRDRFPHLEPPDILKANEVQQLPPSGDGCQCNHETDPEVSP